MPAPLWDRVLKAAAFVFIVGLVIYHRATTVALKSEIAELQGGWQTEQHRHREELGNVKVDASELDRVRRENHDLPKLRNDARQTREELQKLKKENQQLRSLVAQSQQLQLELQQLQPNVQVAETAPVPDVKAMAVACINNLRIFEGAKDQWALEMKKETGATPVVSEIKDYLKGGSFPTCPLGGSYTLNVIGAPATCSIPGHSLATDVPTQ